MYLEYKLLATLIVEKALRLFFREASELAEVKTGANPNELDKRLRGNRLIPSTPERLLDEGCPFVFIRESDDYLFLLIGISGNN